MDSGSTGDSRVNSHAGDDCMDFSASVSVTNTVFQSRSVHQWDTSMDEAGGELWLSHPT